MNTNLAPRAIFVDLPTELLIAIFKINRPLFSHDLPQLEYCGRVMVFRRNLLEYSRLRLVCRTFNQVLSAIDYDDLRIIIADSTSPRSIENLFRAAAPIARSVAIYGCRENDGTRADEGDFKEQEEVIGRCLGKCNALKSLTCYESQRTFPHRAWFPKLAPGLRSTVTSLCVTANWPQGERCLSHILVALGPSLERLEILDWTSSLPQKFHLPSAFPHLTHLILRNFRPHTNKLLKLFSRIRLSPKSTRVPLRSLAFTPMNIDMSFRLRGPHFVALLSTNRLGTFLTAFKIEGDIYIADPTLVVEVVKLCPNLLEFVCHMYPTPAIVLQHLPRKLHHLELSIMFHPDIPAVAQILRHRDIIKFLKEVHLRSRVPTLRSFWVITTEAEATDLASDLSHLRFTDGRLSVQRDQRTVKISW